MCLWGETKFERRDISVHVCAPRDFHLSPPGEKDAPALQELPEADCGEGLASQKKNLASVRHSFAAESVVCAHLVFRGCTD
jgi:hypothetical protein